MDAGADGEVVLEYEVELSEEMLTIDYTVINGTGESIWLTTPLTRVNEEGKVVADPQKVYAYVDPEGVLHITKRVWPVPEDLDVYAPEMPMLTEVKAGGRFGERVRVRVPVSVQYPYVPMRASEHEDQDISVITCRAFIFSVSTSNITRSDFNNLFNLLVEESFAGTLLQGMEREMVLRVLPC